MEEESLAMVGDMGDMGDMGWEDIIHANQVGLLLEEDHAFHHNPDYPPLVHMEEGSSITTKKNKKKRRKRKKKEKEQTEMEYQRMVHISVERNRRRQMNQHLAQLRSLMPPSYLQRGDQASIVGGAIEFVKNLEETLESLIEKRKSRSTVEKATLEPPCPLTLPNKNKNKKMDEEGSRAFCRSWNAEVEVETMGVDGFGVKVVSSEHGQLLRLITHLQHSLLFFIRHLHVTTTNADAVFYSFQLHQRCNHNQVVLGSEQLISVHELAFSVLQIFDSHDVIESDLSAEICNLESPSKDFSTLIEVSLKNKDFN